MFSIFKLNPDYSKRVYGLDVYRAVAIFLVVFQHGNLLVNKVLPDYPYFGMIDGVELFFVLSGFLIGGILIKTIEHNRGFDFKNLKEFWLRRWFRTLPLYYLILIANFILVKWQIIGGSIDKFNWKFIFFLQNFNTFFVDFFWESWSLSVEEWFYILFPFILLLLIFVFQQFISVKKIILLNIVLFIAGSIIYRLLKFDPSMSDFFWWESTWKKIVLFRLDSIIYGVLGAFIKYYYQSVWERYPKLLFTFGLCLTLLNLYCFGTAPLNSIYKQVFYFSCYNVGALLMLPLADSVISFKTTFGRLITHISLISYAMYLINLSCVEQVLDKNITIKNIQGAFVVYGIFWIVVIGLSTLLYKYYEKPLMDLRDRK